MAWSDEPDDTEAPVIVVGAGPVGLLVTNLLADAGIPSVVLERAGAPSTLPRAVHLDDEALRLLQALGLDGRLRPRLSPTARYELRDARGQLLHAFVRERQPLGHPQSVLFHQPDLEHVLRDAAEASEHIELRWGHDVLAVDAVSATLDVRGPGGAAQQLQGSAVLACDGGASTVRRSLGLPVVDRGFEQAWLVVDLRICERPAGLEHPQQRCDPRRPATSVPVGPGRHRFEFMLLQGEREDEMRAGLPALLATWGVDLGEVEVERCAVYRFHAVHAARWRCGDVFLLGDAAHQMPPFFGQGLCSGFRDAANLVWKLALVRRGVAADALLDTYELERRPHAAETIRRTALLGRVITGGGRGAQMLRLGGAGALRAVPSVRRAVEGMRPPPLPRGPLVDRRRPLGPEGHPFPQAPLADHSGAEHPSDTLLGPGFALVGWRTEPLAAADAATRRWWAALGARCVRVDPPADGVEARGVEARGVEFRPPVALDPSGAIGAWFARSRGEVAVVRPDRVVLGVARGDDRRRLAALAARVAQLT
jgi:3-(3-hydroxy-phenyl)propionate hydroxylase